MSSFKYAARSVGARTRRCVRTHRCERDGAFASASASETVHFAQEKNVRTNRELPQLLVSLRACRIAATRRHAVTSPAHTHMHPWRRGPGWKIARGMGGKSSSFIGCSPAPQYPSRSVFPPAPHLAGKTMASYIHSFPINEDHALSNNSCFRNDMEKVGLRYQSKPNLFSLIDILGV